MNVCITGGAGFIGSEMVRQLVLAEENVTVIDSLTYAGNPESLLGVMDHINFLEIDIRDSAKLSKIFKEHDFHAVVNFAAETHVDNSIKNPEIFLETNILGTFNLLELARKYEFKFMQISTDEVYGSIRNGEFVESDKLDPSSPYSASKASAELLMQAYIKTYSINALGVRCSNNYGHYQHHEKLIPAFISRIMNGDKVPVYGDGSNVREWIHVTDSVSGIKKVLESGKQGEFYNISSGDFRSNLEVTRRILQYFDRGDDSIDFVEDRLGHDFRYAIDSSRIKDELGWEPKVDFIEGLGRTIKWYMDNPAYLSKRK
ncbi:RfbB dTDP-D-glucose 4,6-dehydratase [Candidatus Nanopelagicaceae bacterium]